MARSTFDPNKNHVLKHFGRIELGTKARLEVEVASYDNGAPKVCVVKRGGKWETSKIGRLTALQAVDLSKLVMDAATWLMKATEGA